MDFIPRNGVLPAPPAGTPGSVRNPWMSSFAWRFAIHSLGTIPSLLREIRSLTGSNRRRVYFVIRTFISPFQNEFFSRFYCVKQKAGDFKWNIINSYYSPLILHHDAGAPQTWKLDTDKIKPTRKDSQCELFLCEVDPTEAIFSLKIPERHRSGDRLNSRYSAS